jgi:hypothetical protein
VAQWEYTYEESWTCGDIPVLARVNELGADGWELVGIVPSHGNSFSTFVFKRPVAAKPKVRAPAQPVFPLPPPVEGG